MALQFSNAASQALMGDTTNKGLLALIGTGSYIIFYSGSSDSGGPESGTLPTGPLNNKAGAPTMSSTWTNTGNGVITAPSVASGSCNSSGTAASFVLFNSSDAPICYGTVSTSAADINFSGGVSFVSGGTIAISSLTLTYSPH